nr:autotransporter domain-containing protein [Parvibaculum indicum]
MTINDSGNGISKLTIDGGTTVAVNGTTTIGDGTVLQFTGASGGTLLGSGGVAIDGTLLFDQSAGGITVGKDLFGAGIVKVSSGTGTVVLSGDNSAFTGIFNVSGGELDAVSANALGGAQGTATLNLSGGLLSLHDTTRFSQLIGSGGVVSLDGANLVINQETNSSFAGNIDGVGGLTKSGSGLLILTGANSYDGGTLVNAGTLHVSGGSALVDSGDVAVSSAGRLLVADSETIDDIFVNGGTVAIEGLETLTTDAFNMSDGVLEGGIISASGFAFESGAVASNLVGSGALTKSGAGTLLLSGKNTFSGGTTVSEGDLIVTGILGDIVVNGGTIGGTGTIGNTVVAGDAAVAPGNSIGTLNVAGNVILASGSTYEVELNAAGDSDLINAGGLVTVNGGTVNIVPFPDYAVGTSYHIIHADGGRTGTFDAVTGVADSLFLSPTLSYEANDVYLAINQTEVFESVALTPNQIATAGGADSLGPGNAVWDAIASLNEGADAIMAFDALSGEIHGSVQTALLDDSRFPREAGQGRQRVAHGSMADNDAQTEDRSFGIWGQALGSWSQWDSDGNAAALDRSIGGFILGGDAPVRGDMRFGVLGGYSRSTFSVDGRSSSGTADTYTLGAYGGGGWDAFTLTGGVAHSWHSIETSRSVAFSGFSDSLSASYSARTLQAWGEAAYCVETGTVRFEPFANLAHVNLSTDGFTESGGASALTVASNTVDTTFTTLGLRAETDVQLGNTDATLRGLLGWRHAFDDTPPSQMRFASGGDAFTIAGVRLAQDILMLDAGVDVDLDENATLGFAYGGLFGSGVQDHSARLNLNMRF